MGVFARIFEELAAEAAEPATIMIDATFSKPTTLPRAYSRKGGEPLCAIGLRKMANGEWRLIG